MADNQENYQYDGRDDAQLAEDTRDHQKQQNHQNEREQCVRERQRRAEAERRREKRWERWRAHETAIAQRGSVHQPGPHQDARDHRGEVV